MPQGKPSAKCGGSSWAGKRTAASRLFPSLWGAGGDEVQGVPRAVGPQRDHEGRRLAREFFFRARSGHSWPMLTTRRWSALKSEMPKPERNPKPEGRKSFRAQNGIGASGITAEPETFGRRVSDFFRFPDFELRNSGVRR